MTSLELMEVNKNLNFIEIRNKKRGTVKDFAILEEKVKGLRIVEPNASIKTSIIKLDDETCVAHAEISDANGHLLATGTAERRKEKGSTESYIEVAESAAVSRALRFLGIGLDVNYDQEIAKASELEEAELKMKIMAFVIRHKYDESQIKKITDRYNIESLQDMTLDFCRHYINYITSKGGNIDE